ncbi:AraC family transcriptional regulator [Paenibacillus contaminans]|uniref:AraC family transcriptional regulator n=1 Tax=Paenibacillus contaminans TaxID=450362 RepID=A0A329LVL2_9BACL|nr:AraC family transcriptional regulator [Paenibacillus contaminans]RAV10583.1 AraC family transcriptional regulator [Paenibacillus contaminans]
MQFYKEDIRFENPFLSMKIFAANRVVDAISRWHHHKEVEILVIAEGVLHVFVEDEQYMLRAGELVLIGANQLHRDRSYAEEGTMRYFVLQFDIHDYFEQSTMPYYRFLSETDYPWSKLNYIFGNNDTARESIVDSVKQIYDESQTKREGYEIAVSLLIKKIVLTLLRSDNRHFPHHRENNDLLRLRPVLDYIEQNVCGKIQVEEASRIVNMSYYYFVKYFKKVLGMSFLEYVNYKKIKRAERILLTNEVNVAQVGEEVGMPNMAHFYKMFRKYNDCSPHDYRKKMAEWSK